jgi:hypothetical protein
VGYKDIEKQPTNKISFEAFIFVDFRDSCGFLHLIVVQMGRFGREVRGVVRFIETLVNTYKTVRCEKAKYCNNPRRNGWSVTNMCLL